MLWKHNLKQVRQLQNELEKRHHQQYPPPHQQQPQLQHNEEHHHQQLPLIKTKPPHASTKRKEQQGVYYATHRNGRWQRVNPEDLVDSYLRAWSLPPDIANSPPFKVRDLSNHHRRKHHSAMPDLRRQGRGQGRRKEPRWVYSLERMAREDKVEPAHARLTKRKKHKKRRAAPVQIKS